ncbi:hypothetical protein FRC11_012267, partial [Ceratobasidium sp. 423]
MEWHPDTPPERGPLHRYVLVRGHWVALRRGNHPNAYWASLADYRIKQAISPGNRFKLGKINEQQRGLHAGVLEIPLECRSRLQQEVAEFMEDISETTHPLARWAAITFGIRKDIRGVHCQYDVIAYQFFDLLRTINFTGNRNSPCDYMIRHVHAIMRRPGLYAAFVDRFYPQCGQPELEDPLAVTYVDPDHRFNWDRYLSVDDEAVIHYLWVVLKIPRSVARYILEPFAQLSANIECAVKIVMELDDPEVTYEDLSLLWSPGYLEFPELDYGQKCLSTSPVLFECGRFPLVDEVTGAVNWQIPPPSIRD